MQRGDEIRIQQTDLVNSSIFGGLTIKKKNKIFSSRLLPKNITSKRHTVPILHIVLYGCETGSLTVRAGYRLTVLEIRMLKKICGPRMENGIGYLEKTA